MLLNGRAYGYAKTNNHHLDSLLQLMEQKWQNH